MKIGYLLPDGTQSVREHREIPPVVSVLRWDVSGCSHDTKGLKDIQKRALVMASVEHNSGCAYVTQNSTPVNPSAWCDCGAVEAITTQ